MWRYLGCEPPQKRQNKSLEQKLSDQREYDRKKKRDFLLSWSSGRPWLRHVNDLLLCATCQEGATLDPSIKVRNTFVAGCPTMKLEAIKHHEVSANHTKAKAVLKARNAPCETKAQKIICDLNKDVLVKLRRLFLTCHSLALHNRPFSDYEWVCQLDRSKGLDIGSTYNNTTSAKQFTAAIAKYERQKLTEDIDGKRFLTILSDGSTDSSVKEQELFFVRYASAGIINVKFLAIINVDRPDSSSILGAMKEACTILNGTWDNIGRKMVGLGCDGASVMTGKKTGLITRLQEEFPNVVLVHCFAHRLVLILFIDNIHAPY
jgi:hypothetical protein